MSWYLLVILNVLVAINDIIQAFSKVYKLVFTPTQEGDTLIELPVTTPNASVSYIVTIKKHLFNFIVSPLINGYTSVTKTISAAGRSTASHIVTYWRRVLDSIPAVEFPSSEEFGNGVRRILHISEKKKDPFTKKDRRESVWGPAYRHSLVVDSANVLPLYGPLPPPKEKIPEEDTPPLTPALECGSPATTESSGSQYSTPSVSTPAQSPDIVTPSVDTKAPDTDDADISTEANDSGYHSISLEQRTREPDIIEVPRFPKNKRDATCSSIESFSEIERLFEANYGAPVNTAIEDLYDSYTKLGETLPEPLTVYSARVFFRISESSLYNTSGQSNEASADQDDVMSVEEDVTDAALSPDDLTLGLSSIELSENEPVSCMESLSAAGSSVNVTDSALVVSPTSPSASSFEDSDMATELSGSSPEQDDDSGMSSTGSSPQDSSPGSDVLSTSSEASPAHSSLVSTPSDTVMSSISQDLAAVKKTNRSARLNTGLAIDVHNFSSPSISFQSALSEMLSNASTVIASRETATAANTMGIPSIIISPADDDVDGQVITYPTGLQLRSASLSPEPRRVPPSIPLPRLPTSVYNFSLPRRLPRSPLGVLPPFNAARNTRDTTTRPADTSKQLTTRSSVSLTPPSTSTSSRGSVSSITTVVTTTTTAAAAATVSVAETKPQRVVERENEPIAFVPPPNIPTRRVGLRGNAPRYKYTPQVSPTRCFSTPGPASRTFVSEPPSRRVGLRGAAPRQRFFGDEDTVARERAALAERHRARELFFAQRKAHHGPGLRPLLLPLRVAARNEAEPAVARSWGLPF